MACFFPTAQFVQLLTDVLYFIELHNAMDVVLSFIVMFIVVYPQIF